MNFTRWPRFHRMTAEHPASDGILPIHKHQVRAFHRSWILRQVCLHVKVDICLIDYFRIQRRPRRRTKTWPPVDRRRFHHRSWTLHHAADWKHNCSWYNCDARAGRFVLSVSFVRIAGNSRSTDCSNGSGHSNLFTSLLSRDTPRAGCSEQVVPSIGRPSGVMAWTGFISGLRSDSFTATPSTFNICDTDVSNLWTRSVWRP